MIALIQRVSQASVAVEGEITGEIDNGLLVLLGIEKEDTEAKAKRLAERVAGYRIFNDSADKMNLNVKQVEGDILVISQFTLVADTSRGMRPSFTSAADRPLSIHLYEFFYQHLRSLDFKAPTGVFGADMKVSLVNDGPVTFTLTC